MPKKLTISAVIPQVYEAWANENPQALTELIGQHVKLFHKERNRNSIIFQNFIDRLRARMTPSLVSPATLAVVQALPMELRQMAFGKAAYCGTVDDLKLWLAHIDTGAEDCCGVYAATLGEKPDNLRFLLPLVQSVENTHISFCAAAAFGFEEGVRLLLPHVDPQYNESQALANACENGHAKIAQLLIPLSDCENVRKNLGQENHPKALEFLEHQLSILQHTTLSNHVDGNSFTRVRKM